MQPSGTYRKRRQRHVNSAQFSIKCTPKSPSIYCCTLSDSPLHTNSVGQRKHTFTYSLLCASPHLSPPAAWVSIKQCVERWGNVYSLLMLLSPLSQRALKKLQSLPSLHPSPHSSHCSSQVIVQTISSIRRSEGEKRCNGEIERKFLRSSSSQSIKCNSAKKTKKSTSTGALFIVDN